MDEPIPGLASLIGSFRNCFHPPVFLTYQALLTGWAICLGPRTISEVWQATGLAAKRHRDTDYAVFHSAAWEWDDLGIVLATLILTHLIPGGVARVVVDDRLCDKRGEASDSRPSTWSRLPMRPLLLAVGADPPPRGDSAVSEHLARGHFVHQDEGIDNLAWGAHAAL